MTQSPSKQRYEEYLKFRSHAPGYWQRANIPQEQWQDYKWQLRSSMRKLEDVREHLELTAEETEGFLLTGTKLAASITPHFFNLIEADNPNCPIRRQMIPNVKETRVQSVEYSDPCGEDEHMPVPGLVHRYPDRVLFLVTDRCASYCRYCTRSRVVSGVGEQRLNMQHQMGIDYIRNHPEVRDVLLSGGDPLLLSDKKLNQLLTELRSIEHVQFVRIGSRIPLFLPQRITDELCAMLASHHPLFLSIHSNHPRELTTEVRDGLAKLANAGIMMGNQSVLLKGVNDDPVIQRALVHKLLLCRVRPYYLYQCDLIEGSGHLRTSIDEGLAIMESLRGHTSGYAIPQYVVDAPGGGGKIPLNPNYVLEQSPERVVLRNYEGKTFVYPQTEDSEEPERKKAPKQLEAAMAAEK